MKMTLEFFESYYKDLADKIRKIIVAEDMPIEFYEVEDDQELFQEYVDENKFALYLPDFDFHGQRNKWVDQDEVVTECMEKVQEILSKELVEQHGMTITTEGYGITIFTIKED